LKNILQMTWKNWKEPYPPTTKQIALHH